MPYASEKQRRYMHAKHPEIAARWDAEERNKPKRQVKATKHGKGAEQEMAHAVVQQEHKRRTKMGYSDLPKSTKGLEWQEENAKTDLEAEAIAEDIKQTHNANARQKERNRLQDEDSKRVNLATARKGRQKASEWTRAQRAVTTKPDGTRVLQKRLTEEQKQKAISHSAKTTGTAVGTAAGGAGGALAGGIGGALAGVGMGGAPLFVMSPAGIMYGGAAGGAAGGAVGYKAGEKTGDAINRMRAKRAKRPKTGVKAKVKRGATVTMDGVEKREMVGDMSTVGKRYVSGGTNVRDLSYLPENIRSLARPQPWRRNPVSPLDMFASSRQASRFMSGSGVGRRAPKPANMDPVYRRNASRMMLFSPIGRGNIVQGF